MDFTLLKDFMDRLCGWRIPGNTVSVRIGGKEVFNYQSGWEDIEKKIPMQKDSLYNIYSCSKVTTAVAAMQLYEKGYFLLDEPVSTYIPEFGTLYVKGEDGQVRKAQKPLTIRHLLTMTGGLSYEDNTQGFKNARIESKGRMDTLTVVRHLADDPLLFEPGDNWHYSLGLDVMAGVIEVISGQKFRDYVKEHIFEPLGMNDSYYHNEGVRDKMAKLYRYVDSDQVDLIAQQSGKAVPKFDGYLEDAGKDCSYVYGPEYDSGGAGITTSAHDYSVLAAALACGGVGPNGQRILAPGTIDFMRTDQLNDKTRPGFDWIQMKGYGYGIGVRTLVDKAGGSTGNLGEFGWGGAAGATVLADPSCQLSMFYTHHMLNQQEVFYQPRLRNVLYTCLSM